MATAKYWLALVPVNSYDIAGYAPSEDGWDGNSPTHHFQVNRVGCKDHISCADDKYCDLDAFCYDCSACAAALDAIDGVCPEKCGAAEAFVIGDRLPDEAEVVAIGPIRDVVYPETAGDDANRPRRRCLLNACSRFTVAMEWHLLC
jgi:hypothetical protein